VKKSADFPCICTKFLAWVLEVGLHAFLLTLISPSLEEVLLNDYPKLAWNDEVIFQDMRRETKNSYNQGFASFKEKKYEEEERKRNEMKTVLFMSCSFQIFLDIHQ